MIKTRIVLADDQLLIRAGIRGLIAAMPEYELLAECADGHEALAAVSTYQPDVILLDIAMPGPTGIEVAHTIRRQQPATRILVLSSIDRREIIEQALMAGVDGYLLKDFVLAELLAALESVRKGERYLSPRVQQIAVQLNPGANAANGNPLTARQLEVLRMVATGKTTKEIARELQISPKTVEFHRSRLMERIGANDVTGLTRFALQYDVLC